MGIVLLSAMMTRSCMYLVVLLLFSCTHKVYVPTHSSFTVVDTVVRQVADSAVVRALFECDSNNRVVLRELYQARSEQAAGSLDIDSSGRVEVITRWRTQYIDRVKEVRDTTTVVEYREVVKTVKYVPRFFWYCFAVAMAAVGYLGFRLVLSMR